MKGFIIFWSLILVPGLAYSYPENLNQNDLPTPHLSQGLKKSVPDFHVFKNDLRIHSSSLTKKPELAQIQKLAEELDRQFEFALAPLKKKAPTCLGEDSESYLHALLTAGEFEACSKFASACAKNSKEMDPSFFALAARCESTRFNFHEAKVFFELATTSDQKSKSTYALSLIEYAAFALYGIFEKEAESILDSLPDWSKREKTLLLATLKRTGHLDHDPISKTEIDSFLDQMIAKSTGSEQNFFILQKIRVLAKDRNYLESLDLLMKSAEGLQRPFSWYDVAFRLVYLGLDNRFAEAKWIYDAYDKHSNPWFWFPVEKNVYDYEQIYSQVCKSDLLQGGDLKEFNELKKKIQKGHVSFEQALSAVESWNQNHQNKADVLTVLGNLQFMNGSKDKAFSSYWQAHRACRYYNRANWGLNLTKRSFRYEKMPEYQQNIERLERELKSIKLPEKIGVYFSNWSLLPESFQARAMHGARIWLPFVDEMATAGVRAHLKFAFERLSEVPGWSHLNGRRIEGANYPNDNRLWDDVRGVGGQPVVADIAEVFNTVHGDYNLLGHEMAHQFQQFMEVSYRPGLQCIIKQYSEAKKNKNFPDSYSALNKEEHFAQGATYYLVPEDAPKRFGLNRSWLANNDKNQLAFLNSIDSAEGLLERITCF